MNKKLLAREVKAIALTRLEDAARTTADFREVQRQWNIRDKSRMRKEQRHEIGRPNEIMLHWDKDNASDEKGILKSEFHAVVPRPLEHHFWRQLILGDFIDTIYDNADEIWQLVTDKSISSILKDLTKKQKEVLFARIVRLCPAEQVACCFDKTDRAVRKLLVATLEKTREELALIIRRQAETKAPSFTLRKKRFIEWYENPNCDLDSKIIALDKDKSE